MDKLKVTWYILHIIYMCIWDIKVIIYLKGDKVMLEENLKKNSKNGLTMVALVVTVVVLAILTGVIVTSTFGD